jgi:hypothetical protein
MTVLAFSCASFASEPYASDADASDAGGQRQHDQGMSMLQFYCSDAAGREYEELELDTHVANLNDCRSPADDLDDLPPLVPILLRPGQDLFTDGKSAALDKQSFHSSRAPIPAAPSLARAESFEGMIPVVSLGCSCGPRLSFQEMGVAGEALPFDWMTTSIEGIMDQLETNFRSLFQFTSWETAQLPGVRIPITVFRSSGHSWWHDDPTTSATQEKYRRRIKRLNGMRAVNHPILFVRLAATTSELGLVDSLAEQLIDRFGPQAMLLLIVSGQDPGKYMVRSLPNVLFYFMPNSSGRSAYCPAIACGLEWAAGKSPKYPSLHSLREVESSVRPSHDGCFGMGGLPAFGDLPSAIPAPPRPAIIIDQGGAGGEPLVMPPPSTSGRNSSNATKDGRSLEGIEWHEQSAEYRGQSCQQCVLQ